MKNYPAFLIGLVSLVAPAGILATPTDPLQIVERVEPIFPAGVAEFQGITHGSVRCVIDVDVAGKVEDVLVIGYTHPAFARAVSEALPQWRFAPARIDGRAVPSQTMLEFSFEAVGVVVSMDVTSLVASRIPMAWREGYVYRPSLLKEVDRIPIPLQTVKPYFSTGNSPGRVTVLFYIDEAGKVRVPIIETSDSPQLAAAAIAAVKQWRFEPPLRHGRPTLLLASQEFRFGDKP